MSHRGKGYQPASFPPAGQPFRFDGSGRCCPWCHVYICSRSTAVRLPRPVPIDMVQERYSESWVSANTGQAFNYDGSRPRSRQSWYVHERCWVKYGASYGFRVSS